MGSKIESHKIFWCATPILWVVSFASFDLLPFYRAKSWKTQNTVFGYKKGSKIQSDKIFWSATLNLWVVSFATFASKWPEHWLSLGGGNPAGFPPLKRFEICNFEVNSFGPEVFFQKQEKTNETRNISSTKKKNFQLILPNQQTKSKFVDGL